MCWFGPLVHASAALFAEPGFARGDLPAVEIRCAPLTREQTAEVEARARADLMTSGLPVLAADLECSTDRVTITVSAERASNTRTAALYGQNVREALIEALDAALLSLMHPEPTPPPLPDPTASDPSGSTESDSASSAGALAGPPSSDGAPATLAPPTATRPVAVDAPPRDEAARAGQFSPRAAEVGAGTLVEWWQGGTAAGGSLVAGYGSPSLSLRTQFGALTELQKAFDALELSAALGLGWQPEWSEGVRLSASIGVSWLDVAPQAPYEPRGRTAVTAGFAVFELSRPVWFGSWSLIPTARARLFAAERRVNLDGHAALAIRPLVPGLALDLGHSFE